MYIYFNKLGELTTIIPHGEVVRQGSWFTINVALDDDVDISDKNMWFRYKRRGNERFIGDSNYQGHFDMIKEGSIEFKSLDAKEATFDLVDGKYYKVFSYKVNTDTGMTSIDGNVEVVFTLVTSDTDGGTEDIKMEGRANIYVEPTYGLHPERGLDLSVSEYATIMQSINQIQNSYKVKNVVVSQSENEVGDIENTITITYNDAKALTFKSMYLDKYLSDALVNTETMDLTITKSDGEVLTFSGITSEKVMAIILENSVKGKTDIVLKTSEDKLSTFSDNTTLTSLGIYQCFGAYIINLPSSSTGTITSEQLAILTQNKNAVLMMNGIAYTYSMLSNGVYSYHHISGSAEDLIYVNANTREWTTEHKTFDIGDLNEQIEQLKLDLQKKVDKIETVSANTYAYIQYTEDGQPVQSSLKISSEPLVGTLVKRDSNGEVKTRTPTTTWSATTKKYVDDALDGKLDKVTTTSDWARAYVVDNNGNNKILFVDASPSNGSIAMRNEEGHLMTTSPINNLHCTNKRYVDDALATKADLVNGKVPASQLPAYVDDVIEVLKICSTSAELPTASKDNVGAQCICINPSIDPDDTQSLNLLLPIQWARGAICEVVDTESTSGNRYRWFYKEDLRTGAVYITTEDNKTYRYTVSNNQGTMVIIGTDLALGETSSTAYAGDKGKANRDDIDAIIDGGIKVYSAVRDQAGNIIDETYATNEAVDGKVDRVETASIDSVYGVKAENSVEPFQTDSIYNPTSQLTPSTCGKYVIQYKTIIGLVSNGYSLTGLTYNVTESSFTVTNDNGIAEVAFRFNTSADKTYTLRNITLQSTYCSIQYFTSDGTRLGNTSALYSGNQFTVPTYDQEVAYGMITIACTSGGNLTINKLEVVELNATTTDTLFPVTELGNAGTIPLRDANGCIRVANPKTSYDAVNLVYMTSVANGKLDKITTEGNYRLYMVNSVGNQDTAQLIQTPPESVSTYTVPWYTTDGRIKSRTPKDDLDCTNKAYVDDRTLQMKVMTQSEYDGLTTKDENTMYIIIG